MSDALPYWLHGLVSVKLQNQSLAIDLSCASLDHHLSHRCCLEGGEIAKLATLIGLGFSGEGKDALSMVANFSKLDKFEGVDFRRWQKKMYFLLSIMCVVYVLTTPMLEDGQNATVKQIRKRSKWKNDDYVCRGIFVNDRRWFKTCDSLNDGSILYIRNESTTLVHGRGSVDLRFSSRKIVFLFNVVHVPNIRKNLVLSSILNNCGYKQVIESNKFVLPKHGVFLTFGYLSNQILGHVYFKRMRDMSKDGLIPTFDMDSEKCKTCMLTKITKKPFQNVKYEIDVLELIHSDLCDLHATPSLGNKKYFVIFIDDASRIKDEVSDQHSYCFNFEDDPKTFDEAMKSWDVSFWKEVINDEMDSIMGINTWVLSDLPICMKPLGYATLILMLRFSMKDLGEVDVILGIRIEHESNGIAISQSHYIEKVLKKFNYSGYTLVSTLMDTSGKLMPTNG
ncbi:zinc finger, CCHC-type containing protein [Tanacetum coccineum]